MIILHICMLCIYVYIYTHITTLDLLPGSVALLLESV